MPADTNRPRITPKRGDAPVDGAKAARVAMQPGLKRRVLISAFVSFHIVATLVWLMPRSALSRQLEPATRAYIQHVGLWQNWGMFAPEPSNLNIYLSAMVTYRDGSQQSRDLPRMDHLDLATRYYKERFRKYVEYAHQDDFRFVWPSLARYVARVNNNQPNNPPVRVQLYRNWWFVPPPPANGELTGSPAHDWSRYQFFDTAVRPEDLVR